MSTHNLQFRDKMGKFPKYLFSELSEEFRRDSKKFELAMVNEPSVFELSRFDYVNNKNPD